MQSRNTSTRKGDPLPPLPLDIVLNENSAQNSNCVEYDLISHIYEEIDDLKPEIRHKRKHNAGLKQRSDEIFGDRTNNTRPFPEGNSSRWDRTPSIRSSGRLYRSASVPSVRSFAEDDYEALLNRVEHNLLLGKDVIQVLKHSNDPDSSGCDSSYNTMSEGQYSECCFEDNGSCKSDAFHSTIDETQSVDDMYLYSCSTYSSDDTCSLDSFSCDDASVQFRGALLSCSDRLEDGSTIARDINQRGNRQSAAIVAAPETINSRTTLSKLSCRVTEFNYEPVRKNMQSQMGSTLYGCMGNRSHSSHATRSSNNKVLDDVLWNNYNKHSLWI